MHLIADYFIVILLHLFFFCLHINQQTDEVNGRNIHSFYECNTFQWRWYSILNNVFAFNVLLIFAISFCCCYSGYSLRFSFWLIHTLGAQCNSHLWKKKKKNEEKVHCNLNTCHFMKNLCTESFSLIFCSILVNEHNKAVVVIYVFHNSFYDIRFSSLLLLFCMDFFYFILFNSFHFGVLFFSCFFFVFVDLILLELTTAAIFPMDFNRIEILFHFVFFFI